MAQAQETDFLRLLAAQSDADWRQTIATLLPGIHAVDQRATCIWFAFYPVKLWRALTASADTAAVRKKLIIKGEPLLTKQADTSPEFLYGHRYWPQVKAAVSAYVATANPQTMVAQHIQTIARQVSQEQNVPENVLVGITAVAFGTLQQVGAAAFSQPAAPEAYGKKWTKSPDEIVAERAKDDGQGLFGFLKSVDKTFTVNFRENEPGHNFKVVNMQDVTMAAKAAGKPYHIRDERYKEGDGPIPVECRTAACGTCWVGVLSPTEKISPPTDRELEKWKYFGYEGFTGTPDSPIRLACQMKAYGNITLAIPSWCGMIGKLDQPQAEAQTATASS